MTKSFQGQSEKYPTQVKNIKLNELMGSNQEIQFHVIRSDQYAAILLHMILNW